MFVISKELEKNNTKNVYCFSGTPFKIFEESETFLFGYRTDKIGRARKNKGYFTIQKENVLKTFKTIEKARSWFNLNGLKQTEKNCEILSYITENL